MCGVGAGTPGRRFRALGFGGGTQIINRVVGSGREEGY